MSIADAFIAELDHEADTTRRFLERLTDDQLDWRPHERSMSAGQLGLHMAGAIGSITEMAKLDDYELSMSEDRPRPSSVEEIRRTFDEGIGAARAMLASMDDARMQQTWRATAEGEELLAMPRWMMIRSFLLNHLYHHRGQLGVYLRLLGASVPAAYGPSADEMPAFLEGRLATR